MISNISNAFSTFYLHTIGRLRTSKLVLDRRGQAFTDYLIVIALVVCLLALVAPGTKNVVNNISVALWENVQTLVTDTLGPGN